MVRLLVALLLLASSLDAAAGRMDAALRDGALYMRAEFGINRYLVRKVALTSGGNGVVNFAGARIVSALSEVPFERGYVVSGEVDDVPPLRIDGVFLGANHGRPAMESGRMVQTYPVVSGRSLEVDSGGVALDAEWREVPALHLLERYVVDDRVAVLNRYAFSGNETRIHSTVMALDDIRDLLVMAAQAVPLNSAGAILMQRVPGSAEFADWRDISGHGAAMPVTTQGLPQMAQFVSRGNLNFAIEIGMDRAPRLNGATVDMPGYVDLSAARKQYVPAYLGPAKKGDIIEVSGFRRYSTGI